MRGLILAIVLAVAFPALGADEAAPEQAATPLEPALEEPAPVAKQVEMPAGAVARGMFATAITDREPDDSIASLGSDHTRVYYFNEFVGLGGHIVTHRWEYQGELMAEVLIAIGGPRWRAYSSKNLEAGWVGEWTVSVIDESGAVLRKDGFVYEAAAAEMEASAPAEIPASPAQAKE